ncbi:SNW domain-containing protein 1 [Hordeum vulgare]|nr:SNW domain-containing protein 1 [Hordeum vulgare]
MESGSKIACSFPGDADAIADDKAVEEATATLTKADMKEMMLLVRRFYAMLDGTDIQRRKRLRTTFAKYDPARRSTAFNSGAAGRTVSQSEMPFNPLAQLRRRFRRRPPRPSRSRPVPVPSSPPRPLPRRDQDDWKVPPCVYNRQSPDKPQPASSGGAGKLDDQVDSNFARLSEALDAEEKEAREAFLIRNKSDKGSSGGAPGRAAAGKRERPAELEFDEPEQSDDPLDLDQFMSKFAGLGMEDFDIDQLLGSMHIR